MEREFAVLLLCLTCIVVICLGSDDHPHPFSGSNGKIYLSQLAQSAKSLASSDNIPFMDGDIPNSQLLKDYIDANPDRKDNIYPRLVIDGLQIIGKIMYTEIQSTVTFSHREVRDCGDFMNKVSFRPKIDNKDVMVPCIYVAQHAGANVVVLGFAEEGIHDRLKENIKYENGGSTRQYFYDNFFIRVLIPAIHRSQATNVYLRYSEMIERIVRGKVEDYDFEQEIKIGMDEWPIISTQMDMFTQEFYNDYRWRLRMGLVKVGQNIEISEEARVDEITKMLGMQMFVDETLIEHFNIHLAVDMYAEIDDSILAPKKDDFGSAIRAHSGGKGTREYSILGLGHFVAMTVKRAASETLRQIRVRLFESINSEYNVRENFRTSLEDTDSQQCHTTYNDITFQYVQAYLATTHAVYPRRYTPHRTAPASDMVMSGLDPKRLERLGKDYRLWENLVKQIKSGNIPMRLEWVLDTKAYSVIGGKHADDDANFDCLEILFESVMRSVYGFYDTEENRRVEGDITTFLIENLYIIPNFGQHLSDTISSLYLMIFCPLLETFDAIIETEERIESMYDMESLLTVHLAENLLLFMFNGDISRWKDYKLLLHQYKVAAQAPLRVHNARVQENKCGDLKYKYLKSDRLMNEAGEMMIPEGQMLFLAPYRKPESFQRFFLIRQLSLTRGLIPIDNAALAALYVDSCLIAMRHFKRPLVSVGESHYHNWLTVDNYKKEYGGAIPKIVATVKMVQDYFLTPAYLKNVDVIGLFVLRNEETRTVRFQSAKIKSYIEKAEQTIKRYIFAVLTRYVVSGKLQVFYELNQNDIEQLRATKTLMTNKLTHLGPSRHARLSIGAEQFFLEKRGRGSSLRQFYSVPGQLTEEIVRDVFKIMNTAIGNGGLGVYMASIKKIEFSQYPVLPIIFRLWYYGEDEIEYRSYLDFLNYCAYAVTSILSQFKEKETSYTILNSNKERLRTFAANHGLKLKLLQSLGLINRHEEGRAIEPLSSEQTKSVYRYWFGATMSLEQPVDASLASMEKQFFTTLRSNRFHYTPCDTLRLNINDVVDRRQQKLHNYKDENNRPYVPDVYFMTPYYTKQFEKVQYRTSVMKVAHKYNGRRWIQGQDEAMAPKFYPLYMDEDGDTIVNANLYENLPYEAMRMIGDSYYNRDVLMWGKNERTKVKRSDIMTHSELHNTHRDRSIGGELDLIEFDSLGREAIHAWKRQTYVLNLPDDETTGQEEPIAEEHPSFGILLRVMDDDEEGEADGEHYEHNIEIGDVDMPDWHQIVRTGIRYRVIRDEEEEDEPAAAAAAHPDIAREPAPDAARNEERENIERALMGDDEHRTSSAKKRRRKSKFARRLSHRKKASISQLLDASRRTRLSDFSELSAVDQEIENIERGATTTESRRHSCVVTRSPNGQTNYTADDFVLITDTQANDPNVFIADTQNPSPMRHRIFKTVQRGQAVNINVVKKMIECSEGAGKQRYNLRSAGSIESCRLETIGPKRRRLISKDIMATIQKEIPPESTTTTTCPVAEEEESPIHISSLSSTPGDDDDDPVIVGGGGGGCDSNARECTLPPIPARNKVPPPPTAPPLLGGGVESSNGNSSSNRKNEGKRPMTTLYTTSARDFLAKTLSMRAPILREPNRSLERTATRTTTGRNDSSSSSSSPRDRREEEEIVVDIRDSQARDWWIIDVQGDGTCLFHTIDLMLTGYASVENARERRMAAGNKARALRLRASFERLVTTDEKVLGEHRNRLTVEAFNRNVFRYQDNIYREKEYEDLRNRIIKQWGDERALRMLSYLLGEDIWVLFGITSLGSLDWGRISWRGATNRGRPLLVNDEGRPTYQMEDALGPPYTIFYEQIYNHMSDHLVDARYSLLVHTSQYAKFKLKCQDKASKMDRLYLRLNPNHFDIGKPLLTRIVELQSTHTSNGPPPPATLKQGPTFNSASTKSAQQASSLNRTQQASASNRDQTSWPRAKPTRPPILDPPQTPAPQEQQQERGLVRVPSRPPPPPSLSREREEEGEVAMNVQETSANDWYVLIIPSGERGSRVGNCFFNTIDVMLRGWADIVNNQIVASDDRARNLRMWLQKYMTTDESALGEHRNRLSVEQMNRNVFGYQDNVYRGREYTDLWHLMQNGWGDDRCLRLLAYFLGVDFYILYGITSGNRLDWGKIGWLTGETDPSRQFIIDDNGRERYPKKNRLGPPFALLYEQVWREENQQAVGVHWNLLVPRAMYEKFVQQSYERTLSSTVENPSRTTTVMRERFQVGIPLRQHILTLRGYDRGGSDWRAGTHTRFKRPPPDDVKQGYGTNFGYGADDVVESPVPEEELRINI